MDRYFCFAASATSSCIILYDIQTLGYVNSLRDRILRTWSDFTNPGFDCCVLACLSFLYFVYTIVVYNNCTAGPCAAVPIAIIFRSVFRMFSVLDNLPLRRCAIVISTHLDQRCTKSGTVTLTPQYPPLPRARYVPSDYHNGGNGARCQCRSGSRSFARTGSSRHITGFVPPIMCVIYMHQGSSFLNKA